MTTDLILKDEIIDKIADIIFEKQSAEDPALPILRQQLSDCEKRIANLMNAIEEGVVTSTTKTRLEELEKDRGRIICSIAQLESEVHKLTKYEIVSWINKYRFTHIDDAEFQREIYGSFINSIFVYRDWLVFTYNIQGRTKSLTLNEVKSACQLHLEDPAPETAKPLLIFFKDAFGFVIPKEQANAYIQKKLRGK